MDAVEDALEKGEVTWDTVLIAGYQWAYAGPADKGLALEQALRVSDAYKSARDGGEVAVFLPVGAVGATRNGEFQLSLDNAAIRFDWSAAWPLNFEIESLAGEAAEWWPSESDDRKRPPRWGPAAVVNRIVGKDDEVSRFEDLRWPHLFRAYGLATCVLGTIEQENERHPPPTDGTLPAPSETFKSRIDNYCRDMAVTKQRFVAAAQRTAQSRYWRGTLVGASMLVVICALIGAIFWWRGTDAAYAVAIPAGALGAMVSLLQRMSSGKLVLDLTSSRDLLEVFGAVRPFIGAVFGIAVAALLAGGLAPAIEVPSGQELAFFAGVGFLAGFNERWAQDMLKSSSKQLGASSESSGRDAQPASAPPVSSGQLELAISRPQDVPADVARGVGDDE